MKQSIVTLSDLCGEKGHGFIKEANPQPAEQEKTCSKQSATEEVWTQKQRREEMG